MNFYTIDIDALALSSVTTLFFSFSRVALRPEKILYIPPFRLCQAIRSICTLFLRFSVCSRWMQFYYSRVHHPPPSSAVHRHSLFLQPSASPPSLSPSASLCRSLSVSPDLQAQARHTSPLETKLPDAAKAGVRVRLPGTRGPIGCAAIETSNKTFLRAKPICRQATAPFTTSHLPIQTASLHFESVDR